MLLCCCPGHGGNGPVYINKREGRYNFNTTKEVTSGYNLRKLRDTEMIIEEVTAYSKCGMDFAGSKIHVDRLALKKISPASVCSFMPDLVVSNDSKNDRVADLVVSNDSENDSIINNQTEWQIKKAAVRHNPIHAAVRMIKDNNVKSTEASILLSKLNLEDPNNGVYT